MPPLSAEARLKLQRMKNRTPRDANAKPQPRAQGRIRSQTPSSRSATPGPLYKPKVAQNKECPQCQGHNIINDEGKTVCSDCGCLLSESQIAADPTFQEGSNGAAQLLGQHVGAGQATARAPAGTNRTLGYHDSFEQTSQNARKAIKELGASMGLANPDLVERAIHVWTLAFNAGTTKGREKQHVSAICWYIALRRDPHSQHLLVDFAEKTNTPIFFLGRIYQDIIKKTYLAYDEGSKQEKQLYAVNIENLIHKYCADLEFGNDTFRIASEAVRIFKRMDRDWITTGRRPSGLCGAAIILAARMNNYRRTIREVVYTVKVCEVTISKRLEEFGLTAASKLAVNEFQQHARKLTTHDYYQQQATDDGDGIPVSAPPAYYRQFLPKKVRKRKRQQDDSASVNDVDESQSATDNDHAVDDASTIQPGEQSGRASKRARTNERDTTQPGSSSRGNAKTDRQAMPPPPPPIDPALLEASNAAYANMTVPGGSAASPAVEKTTPPPGDTAHGQDHSPKRNARPMVTYTAEGQQDLDDLETDMQIAAANPVHLDLAQRAHDELEKEPPLPDPIDLDGSPEDTEIIDEQEEEEQQQPDIPNHADLKPVQQLNSNGNWVAKTYWPTTASLVAKHPDTPIIPEEEFEGDPEVDDCFLDEGERDNKERIWITKYGSYLQDLHLKKLGRLLDEQNGVVKTRAKRTKPRLGDVSGYEKYPDGSVAQSLGEAYQKLWQHRGHKGMSSKINWERVKEIYREKSPDETSPSGDEHVPQKIFGNGDLLIKKTRKKQPSTRAGREEQKKLNAEKRAAKKAEKEKRQQERAGTLARSSVTASESGEQNGVNHLADGSQTAAGNPRAIAGADEHDDADAAVDQAMAELDQARMVPGGLDEIEDERYDEEQEEYESDRESVNEEDEWSGQEV